MVLVATSMSAQDAQEIMESAAKIYADATAYSAQVDSRTISFVFPPAAEGQSSQYQVANTQYRRLQLKVRRPYDYLLGTQFYSEGPMGTPSASAGPMGTNVNWSYLARTDSSLPKQGISIGGKFSIREVPAEQFMALVNSRLGYRSSDDVVLRHFQAQAIEGAGTGSLLLGLVEPGLIGKESRGRPTYRIIAKTKEGYPIMLWIEQDTFLIVRTIVQRPRAQTPGLPPPRPFGGTAPVPVSSSGVIVVESLYNNQQLNPKFTPSDFIIPSEASGARLSSDQLGFIDVADLVKLAEVGPLAASAGNGAPGETASDADGTPAVAEQSKPAGAIEGQALSYEQMSGIVLIDGDGGTATGFMTKIKDVDFVVTNLHVLVGNKKLTLKTLRGEEIPMLGIFGAVGGDIAIIRIANGRGDLKLAKDVFASSKIGDKVVVVGNRRGGGVATQTSGSIKGIGPSLVEVDANFQPGNSGSPIVNLGTNEVVGVATYSETRRVEVDGNTGRASSTAGPASAAQVEKRWFGFRLDSVSKWEAIDLARWNAQGERIDKFRETSEALHYVIKFDFKNARMHPRLTTILDTFESKYRSAGGNSVNAASEVKDLFRVIRSISDDGMRDLSSGDYYDYYRTCQYWENSISAQLEYRKAIVEVLKKYEANSSLYLSRMRGN